jgi:hypothetical protein
LSKDKNSHLAGQGVRVFAIMGPSLELLILWDSGGMRATVILTLAPCSGEYRSNKETDFEPSGL